MTEKKIKFSKFFIKEQQLLLEKLFTRLNEEFFESKLESIPLKFSGRLKTTGGQYFKKPIRKIQISTRYFTLENAWEEIRDTLGHEMIHYWLDFQGKPCGHTQEFKSKMKSCGFQRYSRLAPVQAKYVYECPNCKLQYNRRKKGIWSCGPCSGKRFNPNFKLNLIHQPQHKKRKSTLVGQLKLFFNI